MNAFRKRHNENVERLQMRFEDIMKIDKSPFDSESWLKVRVFARGNRLIRNFLRVAVRYQSSFLVAELEGTDGTT